MSNPFANAKNINGTDPFSRTEPQFYSNAERNELLRSKILPRRSSWRYNTRLSGQQTRVNPEFARPNTLRARQDRNNFELKKRAAILTPRVVPEPAYSLRVYK